MFQIEREACLPIRRTRFFGRSLGHAILHGLVAIFHPQRREEHAHFIRRAATELSNPLANAIVGRAIVSDRLIAGAIDDALAELQTALIAARAAEAFGIETDLRVLALARLPLTNHHQTDELTATIARLKTSGYGQLIDVALEIVAMLWARDRRTELASLLLGYLEAQGPLYQHPLWIALRAAHLDPIRNQPSASTQIARGRSISQSEILDLVADELANG